MKKIIFPMILLCSFIILEAQNTFHSAYGNGEFQHNLSSYNRSISVKECTDSGFIMAGFRYAIRIDKAGDTVWTKGFNGAGWDTKINCVAQSSDDGFIFGGSDNPSGLFGVFVKTDENGAISWTKQFGLDGTYGYDIIQTNDNGYIQAGRTWKGTFQSQGILVKVDNIGDPVFSKVMGGENTETLYRVKQTSDFGYIMIGNTYSNSSYNEDILLAKLDANGDSLWVKGFGTDERDCGYSVRQTYDGGFAICGNTNDPVLRNDIFLAKINSQGDIEWSKKYGLSGTNEYGYDLVQTPDSGFAVLGTALGQMLLLKTDKQGNFEKADTMGSSRNENAWQINRTLDGGYYLGGFSEGFGPQMVSADPTGNIYIVKTDSTLNSYSCFQKPLLLNEDTVSFSEKAFLNFLITDEGGNGNITFLEEPYGGTHTTLNNIELSPEISIPSCHGGSDGWATSHATGGTTGYLYDWDDGQISDTAFNLSLDSLQIIVSDSNRCSIIDTVIIGQPDSISVSFSIQNETCLENADGSIQLSVSGGTPTYSFNWSNDSTEENISNLNSGTYAVTVTDANDCIKIIADSVPNTVLPLKPTICMVSVDSATGKNMIIWEKINTNGMDYFNVYKEVSANNYQSIGAVPFTELTTYVDLSSNPEVQADRYKISIVDTCGNESALSDYHQTIHLSINMAIGNGANLIWTHYNDEENGTAFGSEGTGLYYIYRGTSEDNLAEHHSLSSSFTQWTDTDTSQLYYYYIAAQKIDTCDPAGLLKANAGPFSRSVSNLEDNRQQSTNFRPQAASLKLQVYPNPMTESCIIEFKNANNSAYTLRVLDVSGKVIRSDKVYSDIYFLRKENMLPGYYIIELSGEQFFKEKLIVQ